MENITHEVYQSKYLEEDHPIIIKRNIARALQSDRQAYFLQQVKYWIGVNMRKPKNQAYYNDGRWWMYNTLDEWHDQFPWLSVMTIRRIIDELKKNGLLITGNYNKKKYDKTVWYSIDERKLDELIDEHMTVCSKRTHGSVQNEHMDLVKKNTPIPEITQEINAESGALNFENNKELKNLIVKWKELYNNLYGITPKVNNIEGKLIKDLLTEHGYRKTEILLTLYLEKATAKEKENGSPLLWINQAMNRLLTDLKKCEIKEGKHSAQVAAEQRREEAERLRDEQLDKERAEWESLPEAEKERIRAERKRLLQETLKEALPA